MPGWRVGKAKVTFRESKRRRVELPVVGTKSSGGTVAGSRAMEAKSKNTNYIKKQHLEEGNITPHS